MSTIVQNINALVNIKHDLREILIDNYGDPGDLFSDYPQYFYDMFHVLETKMDNTNLGVQVPEVETIFEVPPPVIQAINRYVYITHPWDGADIYFSVDGSIYSIYTSNFPIPHDMTLVRAYAVYNRIKSTDAEDYIQLPANIYPIEPVLVRDEGIMTITTQTEGGSIYYEIIVNGTSSGFQLYTGPFQVFDYQTVGAYTAYTGNASNEVYDYATGELPVAPATPVLTRSENTVYISCETADAIIWYKIGDGEWNVYTNSGVAIPENSTITIYAKSVKTGLESNIASETYSYIAPAVAPATPAISFSNNTITINCGTAGATIEYQYDGDADWTPYTGAIVISEDVTIRARSYKDNLYSEPSEWVECLYAEQVVAPANPVISCTNNVVTITCSTSGATIYYSTDNGVTYNEYTGTITISADTTFYAYSELNGETSNTVSYEADYEEEPQPVAPADPVISCTNNVVTITCSTSGAVIWYSTDGGNTYNIYTEPITISADTTFYAYSSKDGVNSNVVGPYYAEYLTAPVQPTVSVSNNEITITCSTEGATIYYCIVTSIYSTRNYVQYNSPIIFDASPYTPDNNVYLYTYSSKNGLDSKSYRYNILIPIPPVITNIYNEISITSTYSNYYGTIYYKINSEGTYTVYDKPFMINEACTIYAYVYTRWGVNSAVVEEVVEELSSIKFSPWITATYIKYDLPISKYDDFKGFYQLSNVKKSWGGSDNIRFVLDGEKLYIQLPNRTFIKDMKTSVTWTGLNAESHNTSTVIPSSSYSIRFGPGAPMWFWNMDPTQFTPGNTTDNNYTMSISSFTNGNVYVGNYSGTCTADFSVPKLDSTSNTTVYLSNMGQGFQKVITNYNQWSGGGDGQPIFNNQIRFEPLCKYTYSSTTKNEYPFRFNDITTRINGVQFYSSTHNKYLYNGIGIVLNTASNQNI